MTELSIGEMADLNGISRKTLRVYQDMGLLDPVRVDDETGYRFYSPGQSFAIERIQHLQQMGATLSEVKEALTSSDPNVMAALAKRCYDALGEEIDRLSLARYNAKQIMQQSERGAAARPLMDAVLLEHIPARHVIELEIEDENFVLPISGTEGPNLQRWEIALCHAKARMYKLGIPLELFQNIGMSMSLIDLERDEYQMNKILVFLGSDGLARRYGSAVVPEGDYITVHKSSYFCEQGNAERVAIDQLRATAEDRGVRIVGDCIEEIIMAVPSTQGLGRDAHFKMQAPIVWA